MEFDVKKDSVGIDTNIKQSFAALKCGDEKSFRENSKIVKEIYADNPNAYDELNGNLEQISVNDWLFEADNYFKHPTEENRRNVVGWYYEWLTDEDWHGHVGE